MDGVPSLTGCLFYHQQGGRMELIPDLITRQSEMRSLNMSKYLKVKSAVLALMAVGMFAAPVAMAQAPASAAVSVAVPSIWPFPDTCGGRAYAPPGFGLSWGPWSSSTCLNGGFPGKMQ